MPRLGIGDLPPAAPPCDPEHAPLDAKGKKRFETTAEAAAENSVRVELLRRQARKQSKLFRRRDVRRLRGRLAKKRRTPSLASALYLHELRRRIAGALWALVSDGN